MKYLRSCLRNVYTRTFSTVPKFFLSQIEAQNLDQELFDDYRYSVDQLMELAGLSVACAVSMSEKWDNRYRDYDSGVLIVCGPGNNGGDGLTAARHLKQFGYKPSIFYPKKGNGQLFENLVIQCRGLNIDFLEHDKIKWDQYGIVIDALFGFSYKPPLRPSFYSILDNMSKLDKVNQRLVSIDIPSGWHVENGPPEDGTTPILMPDCLISLSAPKLCAKKFEGNLHWLGGRFIPPGLAKKYHLEIPSYPGIDQCQLLNRKC